MKILYKIQVSLATIIIGSILLNINCAPCTGCSSEQITFDPAKAGVKVLASTPVSRGSGIRGFAKDSSYFYILEKDTTLNIYDLSYNLINSIYLGQMFYDNNFFPVGSASMTIYGGIIAVGDTGLLLFFGQFYVNSGGDYVSSQQFEYDTLTNILRSVNDFGNQGYVRGIDPSTQNVWIQTTSTTGNPVIKEFSYLNGVYSSVQGEIPYNPINQFYRPVFISNSGIWRFHVNDGTPYPIDMLMKYNNFTTTIPDYEIDFDYLGWHPMQIHVEGQFIWTVVDRLDNGHTHIMKLQPL